MSKKKIVMVSLIAIVFIFFILTPKRVNISYNYPTVSNYNELIESSSYIVKGYFTKYSYDWNMYRDVNNEPHKIFETIGKVYEFKVSEVYKGSNIDNNILINQQYSDTLYYEHIGKDSSLISSDSPKVIVKSPLFIEPEYKKEYILFLDHSPDNGLYFPAVEPFLIEVDGDNLVAKTNLNDNSIKSIQKTSNGITNVEIGIEFSGAVSFNDEMQIDKFKDMFKKVNKN